MKILTGNEVRETLNTVPATGLMRILMLFSMNENDSGERTIDGKRGQLQAQIGRSWNICVLREDEVIADRLELIGWWSLPVYYDVMVYFETDAWAALPKVGLTGSIRSDSILENNERTRMNFIQAALRAWTTGTLEPIKKTARVEARVRKEFEEVRDRRKEKEAS